MPHSDVKVQTVVSTAKEHKYKWKFITEDNAPRYWFAKEFDDSLWPKGTAAFGRSSVWTTQASFQYHGQLSKSTCAAGSTWAMSPKK